MATRLLLSACVEREVLRAIGQRPTKTLQTRLHFPQEAKMEALALLVQGKEQSQFVPT